MFTFLIKIISYCVSLSIVHTLSVFIQDSSEFSALMISFFKYSISNNTASCLLCSNINSELSNFLFLYVILINSNLNNLS